MTKIKDKVTGEIKTAVYALHRGKMLFHVDSKPMTDKKFDKQYEIVKS